LLLIKFSFDLIDGVEANQLQRGFSSKRLDRLFKYLERITGIAAKGYVHHLAKHSRENYVTNGNHINDLEVFWGYLKRKLVEKEGIRQSRLHLYIREYVWRFTTVIEI
jgi:hypothetical protein